MTKVPRSTPWIRAHGSPLAALWLTATLACGGGSASGGTGGGTEASGTTGTTGDPSAGGSSTGEASSTGSSTGSATGSSTGSSTGGSTGDPCACMPGECPPACTDPLAPEVGFVELEPVSYRLHKPGQSLDLTASAARMWYAFQPAADTPEDRPLLVLFNGGPGAASEVIFGFNVSERSLDPAHNGGTDVGPSPAPWTGFANLLAIDARITGYAYNMVEGVESAAVRNDEFTARNFNPFLDGADFVRALLRFLADHPELRENQIVLVGESYGGTRATIMLDLLLDYAAHGTGELPYEDDALVAEIQEHLDAVFPQLAGQVAPPELIAQQFSHQVLVQPLLLGGRQLARTGELHDQPGSVIFQIASDTGTTFVPCSQQGPGCDPYQNAIGFVESVAQRDRFAYPRPQGWLFAQIDSIGPKLATLDTATTFFGVDLTAVPELYAAARTTAYRGVDAVAAPLPGPWLLAGPPPPLLVPGSTLVAGGSVAQNGDFPDTFGGLAAYDTYYMPSNYVVLNLFYGSYSSSFDIDPYEDLHARNFLRNLAHVETFITHAAWDLVIWGPAIPATMAEHTVELTDVTFDPAGPMGAERPGQVLVNYQDGAFGLPVGPSRTIRMPAYSAGHTASLDQPAELAADVEAWLMP